jgi:hypothetical protein
VHGDDGREVSGEIDADQLGYDPTILQRVHSSVVPCNAVESKHAGAWRVANATDRGGTQVQPVQAMRVVRKNNLSPIR